MANQHGGRRPGAGRKPSPILKVDVHAKVSTDLKQWLAQEAQRRGITMSRLIYELLEEGRTNLS
jgi:hypothetical protein